SVQILTLDGTNTVNLYATPPGLPVRVEGSSATDTVNVGYQGSVQAVQGDVYVENPPSFSTLVVDDSADATARTVTLDTFTPAGDTAWGSITGLAPAAINYEYIDTRSLTVDTGTADGTIIDVAATGVPTNLVSHSDTQVHVGSGGSVQGIQGTLNIENPPRLDTIDVDDFADG